MSGNGPTRAGNQDGEFYNYSPEVVAVDKYIDGANGNITRQTIEAPRQDSINNLEQHPFGSLQGQNPAYETVYVPTCSLLDIDQSVKKLFEESLKFPSSYFKGVNKKYNLAKPIVKLAGGDKFALAKKLAPLRTDNGSLILPSISIRRTNINHSLQVQNSKAISSATGEVVVKLGLDSSKDPFLQNLLNKTGLLNRPSMTATSTRKQKRNRKDLSIQQGSLLDPKTNLNTYEYLVIPSPTFVELTYEIVLWTEDIAAMNCLIQTILSSKLPMDSGFVLTTDAGYWFMSYLGESISMEDNFDDYTEQEKIVKTKLDLTVKAFLLSSNDGIGMYPIKKYTTAVSFDFEVKTSSYKIHRKEDADKIGTKQAQDKFILSNIEGENIKPNVFDDSVYYEKTIKNELTNKIETVYAEVKNTTGTKETVYSATSIDTLISFLSDE